jgi:hypothetical protein
MADEAVVEDVHLEAAADKTRTHSVEHVPDRDGAEARRHHGCDAEITGAVGKAW